MVHKSFKSLIYVLEDCQSLCLLGFRIRTISIPTKMIIALDLQLYPTLNLDSQFVEHVKLVHVLNRKMINGE